MARIFLSREIFFLCHATHTERTCPALLFFLAVQPSEREAPAALRHDSLHVHGGRAEEALPADARAHEAAQRQLGQGGNAQDQIRVKM